MTAPMAGPRWLQILIPKRWRNWIRYRVLNGHARRYYSQEGEDIILARIFEGQKSGLYVDVGAHHPKRYSNTYLLYRAGWSGINIDAMPGSMRAFEKMRPHDINLEMAIAEDGQALDYHLFNEPAVNTMDARRATAVANSTKFDRIQKCRIHARSLATVLGEHADRPIDLLSVDVEGLELEVLKSNDWELFRPRMIVAEISGHGVGEVLGHPVAEFLFEKNYRMIAKTFSSCFFEDALAPSSILHHGIAEN